MTTCLGLNGTISLAAPLGRGHDVLGAEDAVEAVDREARDRDDETATSTIHRRINRLPIENRCIRDPFDER